jgi:molybdopterin-guanine dinucleotide biosynthesis protein A
MPFIAPALVRAMARLATEPPPVDALLMRSPAGLEYLHAVYAASCLPAIETALAGEDRSLRHLVSLLRVREMSAEHAARYDPRGLSAFNANTPEEWARALDIARDEEV